MSCRPLPRTPGAEGRFGIAVQALAVLILTSAVCLQPTSAADQPSMQGVIRGAEEALLSSEMAGRIVRIADDGETFRKGETLVEFACENQRAEEDVARASEQGFRAQFDNQVRLESLKSGGALDRAMAEAHLAEAQARTRVTTAKSRLCRVVAPYDGFVIKREAKTHESVNLLAPLLRVARQGRLEVVVIAPAPLLRSFKLGTAITFTAATTGQQAQGKITHLGAGVDSSSQTFELRGELGSEQSGSLKPGLAGTVTFQLAG